MLKAGSDLSQTKLSAYYGYVATRAADVASQSPGLCYKSRSEENSVVPILMENAKHNSLKLPQQRRHDFIIATSLLIFAGPMADTFLYRNMPTALPCLRTVQRIIFDQYNSISEGEFRFDEFKLHLESYGTSKLVTMGEDATRVIGNRLVGFVLRLLRTVCLLLTLF